MVNYTDEFPVIKQTLPSWDKFHLGVVYLSFCNIAELRLLVICWEFFSILLQKLLSIIFH